MGMMWLMTAQLIKGQLSHKGALLPPSALIRPIYRRIVTVHPFFGQPEAGHPNLHPDFYNRDPRELANLGD